MKVFEDYRLIEKVGEMQMFSASLNCALGGSAEYGDVLTFCIKINPQVLCDEIRLNITDDDTGEIKKYIAHKNENTFSVWPVHNL